MACPYCGADAVRRDYAPPRPFAYLLGGAGLLIAMVFLPEAFASWGEGRRRAVRVVALGALLIGSVESVRHGNRYCAACGMKFRACRRSVAGFDRAALLDGAPDGPTPPDGAAAFPFAAAKARAGHGRRPDGPPADTPIPPLLKVLRFRNAKHAPMRAEALDTLRRLSGEDFGDDAEAWERWYAARVAAEAK